VKGRDLGKEQRGHVLFPVVSVETLKNKDGIRRSMLSRRSKERKSDLVGKEGRDKRAGGGVQRVKAGWRGTRRKWEMTLREIGGCSY